MSYRYYLYRVEKKLINKIRKCKSKQEIVDFLKTTDKYDKVVDEYNDGVVICLYKLSDISFELGIDKQKEVNEIEKRCNPLFKDKELQSKFDDHNPMIGGESVIRYALDSFFDRVININQDLIDGKFNEWQIDYCEEKGIDTQKFCIIEHLERRKRDWEIIKKHYSKDSRLLTNSWLYEHTIFDLMKFHKEFNPKKEYVLFLGW